MSKLKIQVIFTSLFAIFSCNKNLKPENTKTSEIAENTENNIDIVKRDIVVKKYNLLNFPNLKEPTLISIDEFFDGNNDEASIAPNLIEKPKVSEYDKVLKKISENPKVTASFVKLNEVMIYDDGKLNDNEWFFSDMIYIIGDLTKEEIKEATKSLHPDEVEYDDEITIRNIDEKYKDKKIVYIWWD